MRASLIATLALAAAACSGGNQNQAAPAANAPAPATNQVAQLSEGQRNAVFIRALRDAGFDCQHVERSVPAGTVQNLPAWRATCQGGGEWTIVVAPDGTAEIVPQSGTQAAGSGNGQ